jgi:hypothetical protein
VISLHNGEVLPQTEFSFAFRLSETRFNLVSKLSETEANFASKFSDDLFNFDSKLEAFCVLCLHGCHECGKHAMQLISRNWAFVTATSYTLLLLLDNSTAYWISVSTFVMFCSSSLSEILSCAVIFEVPDATFSSHAVDMLLLRRHLSTLTI